MSGIDRLHEIMTRLRDPQAGCPWDREQTLESLKPCLLEETHELLAAMDRPEDKANHIEELGDVDGNGSVGIADFTELIDQLRSG